MFFRNGRFACTSSFSDVMFAASSNGDIVKCNATKNPCKVLRVWNCVETKSKLYDYQHQLFLTGKRLYSLHLITFGGILSFFAFIFRSLRVSGHLRE